LRSDVFSHIESGEKHGVMTATECGSITNNGYVVFNDNSALDAVEGAGLHYFSTNAGVKALGSDRWGMIFGQSGNTAGSQFYHLIPSSGSAPSSEL